MSNGSTDQPDSPERTKLDYESALHTRLPPSDSLAGDDDESFGCALYMLTLLLAMIGLLVAISRNFHPLKVAVVLGSLGAGTGMYIAARHRRWKLIRGMSLGFVLTAAFAALVYVLWTVSANSMP